jgi:hypothetical protein
VTKQSARTVANLMLLSAGLAAGYAVYTMPPVRRLVGWGLRRWLGASIPMFVLIEARRAWKESGHMPSRSLPGTRAVRGAGAVG